MLFFFCNDTATTEIYTLPYTTLFRSLEGSYACHQALWPYYHLRIFLTVDPREQLRRIEARSGPEKLRQFIDRWIPLEEQYFRACSLAERCDFLLEV